MPLVKTIGFVVFRRTSGGIRYLLLHHRGPYWNFPKGRQEAVDGGDELATAYRELREETGLTAAAVKRTAGFRSTYRYRFTGRLPSGKREPVLKEAIFFLGELTAAPRVIVSREHLGFAWCDFPTAWRRLYYGGGRRVLQAAAAALHHQRTSEVARPRRVDVAPRGAMVKR